MSRPNPFSRRSIVIGMAAAILSLSGCLTISEPREGLSVFSITGGNNQVVVVNTIAPAPLGVRALDEVAGGMPGIPIQWTIASGTGTLSATSTETLEDGTSAINFTAGSESGPVLVRATAQDLRVTFTVEVIAQPPA